MGNIQTDTLGDFNIRERSCKGRRCSILSVFAKNGEQMESRSLGCIAVLRGWETWFKKDVVQGIHRWP